MKLSKFKKAKIGMKVAKATRKKEVDLGNILVPIGAILLLLGLAAQFVKGIG